MKFDFGRDILKIIAILSMTIDHIGVILYPEFIFLRIIGRLAFPIFGYLIAIGLRSTKKPKKYFITLLIFGLISQIPYYLAFNIQPFERLNIFFSLLLGALTIYFFKKKNYIAIIPLVLSLLPIFEGSFYGVLTILFMDILLDNKKTGILALLALNSLFLFESNIQAKIQIFSLAALAIILLHVTNRLKFEIIIPNHSFFYIIRKYFFYFYYPLHLVLLFLISNSI